MGFSQSVMIDSFLAFLDCRLPRTGAFRSWEGGHSKLHHTGPGPSHDGSGLQSDLHYQSEFTFILAFLICRLPRSVAFRSW